MAIPVLNAIARLCPWLPPARPIALDRERVEAALQRSEATNRALLAAIPDLMIRMRTDGTYLDFKPARDFQVVMPDPHMQGKNLFEVMPKEIADQRMHYIQQAIETGTTQIYEYAVVIKGQTYEQEARITASGPDEVLVIVRDISARKRSEAELEARVQERTAELLQINQQLQQEIRERRRIEASLRRSEMRFRRIVDSNMLGIFFAQQDGQITQANDAFLALVGYSRSELQAGTMNWHNLTPADRQQLSQIVSEELQRFGVTRTFEKEYLHKDGRRIPVLVGIALMADSSPEYDVTFVLDITSRKRVEEQLKASLNEKELLLREVHHRVKNNLQVICSMFALQSQYLEDAAARSILLESQDRIRSMALIHEKLYQRDSFAHIDFADYIRSLASDLFATYAVNPNQVRLCFEVADVPLNLDTAIPCGLLINELVSNSLKHAFPDQRSGKITVRLTHTDQQMHLEVSDDGVGLPAHVLQQQTNTLGLRLVRALTRQIEGTLTMSSSPGSHFSVVFPQPNDRQRDDA